METQYLKDKVALITGGTSGIGLRVAKDIAIQGGIPVVSYGSNDDAAQKAIVELREIEPRAELVKFNVAVYKDVKSSIEKIISQFDRIDILINNAGITRDKLLVMMPEAEWDAVLDINLIGAVNCANLVSEHMIKNGGGKIVNVASTGGIVPNVAQTNYSSSKSALIDYTRVKAKELVKYNIQMNAVAPGFIDTQMTSKIPQKFVDKYLEEIPMNRMGKQEEVSESVMFFLRENSGYVLGHTLVIDGGLTL
ncbi:MAG: SDR family oxidoreductase [Bacteroidales bacterium]|nr:SDR family oxidoreductase [Bacteroidales bacterium]